MKVLHVIPTLNTGGAEVALCRLLECWSDSPEHTVVTLARRGVLSPRVRDTGAKLVHLDTHLISHIASTSLRLRQLLKVERPDLIHGWMYHANVISTVAAAGLGFPMVWGIRHSLHELKKEKWRTRVAIYLARKLSRQPAYTLYNSSNSAEQHKTFGYYGANALVIPNGFDTGVFVPDPHSRVSIRDELGISQNAFLIGLVARFHPIKDHANFLQAASLFARLYPEAKFLLVGDDVARENLILRDYIYDLGIHERVHLCGRRSDTPAINAALDIACSSSWGEAFPNAIGEAMSCAVPCVATDVGDVRAVIGDTGIVVPPRNPEALCAAWVKLAKMDLRSRQVLGEKARQRIVEYYGIGEIATRYADVYKRLAQR